MMLFRQPILCLAPDGAGGGGGGAAPAPGQPGAPASAPAPQDKAGAVAKPVADVLPDDPAALRLLLQRERDEKAHLLTVHEEMKTKYTARTAAEEKAREEALKKQGEFEKLYAEAAPKVETLAAAIKRHEVALAGYYEAELLTVPENLRGLIPEGDVVAKLEWLTKAKASGALGTAVKKAPGPDGSPAPKGGSTLTVTREVWGTMTAVDQMDFVRKGGKVV